jgi:hypothetical protein
MISPPRHMPIQHMVPSSRKMQCSRVVPRGDIAEHTHAARPIMRHLHHAIEPRQNPNHRQGTTTSQQGTSPTQTPPSRDNTRSSVPACFCRHAHAQPHVYAPPPSVSTSRQTREDARRERQARALSFHPSQRPSWSGIREYWSR